MLNIIAGTLSVGVTPSTNSYESIATVTVGSGGASTIDFTSIPSTYTHLQLRVSTTNNATQATLMRLNSDTGSNYSFHYLYSSGTSLVADSGVNTSYMYVGNHATTIPMIGVIDILDYANTNKYKTVRVLSGSDTNNTNNTFLALWSGLWRSTSAITSVNFYCGGSTNFGNYAKIGLYGIKGV